MCKYCPTPDIEPFKLRVREGVKFLDAHGPDDWRGMIAPKRLDLTNGERCVLGQIFGDYHDGERNLNICDEFAVTLGFMEGDSNDDNDDPEARDRALTAAWRAVLAESVPAA